MLSLSSTLALFLSASEFRHSILHSKLLDEKQQIANSNVGKFWIIDTVALTTKWKKPHLGLTFPFVIISFLCFSFLYTHDDDDMHTRVVERCWISEEDKKSFVCAAAAVAAAALLLLPTLTHTLEWVFDLRNATAATFVRLTKNTL